MNSSRTLVFLFSLCILSLFSCSKGPVAIDYGKDACHYCRMTIVDKVYGAEIITDKGKVFKFDAAECLINFQNELESTDGFQLLTNHFEEPEAFVPAAEATYLISENLPSPMGESLTAFKTKAKALELQKEKGGEIYTWTEIQKQIK